MKYNAKPTDYIFKVLPTSLRILRLLSKPHPDNIRVDLAYEDKREPMLRRDMLPFITGEFILKQVIVARELKGLKDLRLGVCGEIEPSWLSNVNRIASQLVVLHLHAWPNAEQQNGPGRRGKFKYSDISYVRSIFPFLP